MRKLAIGVLLGLAAGYLLARVESPEETPRRATSNPARVDAARPAGSDAPVIAHRDDELADRAERLSDPPAAPPPIQSRRIDVPVDSLTHVPEQRLGTLEIVPGHRELYVVITSPRMATDPNDDLAVAESTLEHSGEPMRFRLWPGRYIVRWDREDPDQTIRRHVRVRAGVTTTLDLNREEASGGAPVPSDRARLRVSAFGLDGDPLPFASVELYLGFGLGFHYDEIRLDGRGATELELAPTMARLVFGAQQREVDLVAGQESVVEFRPDGEGAVRVQGVQTTGVLGITAPNGPNAPRGEPPFGVNLGPLRMIYVPPGEYDVWWAAPVGSQARYALGRHVVEANRETIVNARLPTGGLDLEAKVETDETGVDNGRVEFLPGNDGSPPGRITDDFPWKRGQQLKYALRHLSPGAWTIRVTLSSRILHEEVVEIGDRIESRTLTLVRPSR